jgi:hypothetical protein
MAGAEAWRADTGQGKGQGLCSEGALCRPA